MAITSETITDRIEVLEDGQLQVREAKLILEDGIEVSRTFHRYVLDPGRDEVVGPTRDQIVQDVVEAVWTTEIINNRISAHLAAQAEE